jgi:hypothetical protein
VSPKDHMGRGIKKARHLLISLVKVKKDFSASHNEGGGRGQGDGGKRRNDTKCQVRGAGDMKSLEKCQIKALSKSIAVKIKIINFCFVLCKPL